MKTLLIIFAVLLTTAEAHAENYQCTANGYKDGIKYSVDGYTSSNKNEAIDSAYNACFSKGWSDCALAFCRTVSVNQEMSGIENIGSHFTLSDPI